MKFPRAEQYVRRATRGLRGRTRREVELELRHHIGERQRQLMATGLGETEALERTLAELGSADTVRRALLGTHPPLHLFALAVFTGLALLTLWQFRDVQVLEPFTNPGPYGVEYRSGTLRDGMTLGAWSPQLPPGVRVTERSEVPVLRLPGDVTLPLTGGRPDDRPLVQYHQTLDSLIQRYVRPIRLYVGAEDHLSHPLPGLLRLQKVRGPFLDLDRLALRAYRQGLSVALSGREPGAALTVEGVRLPGETGPRFTDWAEHAQMKLTAEQVLGQLSPAQQQRVDSHGFELWAVPGEGQLVRAKPEAEYVLLARAWNPARAAGEPATFHVGPLRAGKADGKGVLRLPELASFRRHWSEARLYPDARSWLAAPVNSPVLPLLLVRAGPTYRRGQAPDILAPVILGQPYSFALAQPAR